MYNNIIMTLQGYYVHAYGIFMCIVNELELSRAHIPHPACMYMTVYVLLTHVRYMQPPLLGLMV